VRTFVSLAHCLGEMAISGKVLPFAHKRSKKTTQP
jgi:hypothetical protein